MNLPGRVHVYTGDGKGKTTAALALASGNFDLVIPDEACIAVWFGLIKETDLIDLADTKSERVELVFTGQRAGPNLIARADLVTEMRQIKHYYTKGVPARKGIES